jgi:hypothetical protein
MSTNKKIMYVLLGACTVVFVTKVWLSPIENRQEPAFTQDILQREARPITSDLEPLPMRADSAASSPLDGSVPLQAELPPSMDQQLEAAQDALDKHQAELEEQLQVPIPQVIVGDQGQSNLPELQFDPEMAKAAHMRAHKRQQEAALQYADKKRER